MTTFQRQQLYGLIDALPDSVLLEVTDWLQAISRQYQSNGGMHTPYIPVALGGLWHGLVINDDDITAVRRTMQASFEEALE